MKRYIEQLIEEIDDLIKTDPPYKMAKPPGNFEEEMELAEKVAMGTAGIPVTRFSKITRQHLPPPEELKDNEIELMNSKLNKLLNHCHTWIEFPNDTIPERFKYELLRDYWEEFEIPVYDVCCHWDFCEGSCESCRVSNYCSSAFKALDPEDNDSSFINEFFEDENEWSDETEEEYIEDRKERIKSFIKTTSDKNYIPGIFNYCDNWCDKCELRERCSSYRMEKEVFNDSSYDMKDPKFGSEMKAITKATEEILEEFAPGITEDIDKEENYMTIRDSAFKLDEKKIMLMAEDYAKRILPWFQENQKLPYIKNEKNSPFIKVIFWYHIFIPAKLKRALTNFKEEDDYVQNDSNGSAKIALIAIDKSMNAWTELMNKNTEVEDFAMQICIHLKRLKKEVENRFPEAWKFVRPGFDERGL